MEIIDPVICPEWDSLLTSHPVTTVFHSSGWAKAIADTYRYNRKYFVVRKANRLLSLFPFMEINSWMTGKRGVSLPFSDYCDCIETEEATITSQWEQICHMAENAGWKYIEIRARNFSMGNTQRYNSFFGHELILDTEESVWNRFKGTNRTIIRKAKKEGVTISFSSTMDAVRSFYDLNCITRKWHGLPPQPFSFFESLQSNLLSTGNGFVALASYRGMVIAGIVCRHFGKKAHYKFGASIREHQHLGSNNLLIWEAIRWYLKEGFESFCFGRTDLDNKGLRNYKLSFGSVEYDIPYFRYGTKGRDFFRGEISGSKVISRTMQMIPVPILKIVGKVFYRHMG